MGEPGGSPEARLDELIAKEPGILVLAGEARQVLERMRSARGPASKVQLLAVEGRHCPGVMDLILCFEGLPVAAACAKLDLWDYAHRRASVRTQRVAK